MPLYFTLDQKAIAILLFSELIVWYLFLGGAGSGTYLVMYLVRSVSFYRHAKSCRKLNNELSGETKPIMCSHATLPSRTVWLRTVALSLAILVISGLCLLKDLALPGQAWFLFVKPTFSLISIGSYILLLFALSLLLLLFIVGVICPPKQTLGLRIIEALAALLSIGMMLYTGAFLLSIAAVPLWSSITLPFLFLLSSCSSGIALVMIILIYTRARGEVDQTPLILLLRVDLVIITLEALVFALMYWQLHATLGAALSFEQLFTGELSQQFWFGFVFCAILVPLIVGVIEHLTSLTTKIAYVLCACSILIGSFFLRFCLVNAGIHTSFLIFV